MSKCPDLRSVSSGPGSRSEDKKCAFLKKRRDLLVESKVRFCYECDTFPCRKAEAIEVP
jgi:hypothetical protein